MILCILHLARTFDRLTTGQWHNLVCLFGSVVFLVTSMSPTARSCDSGIPHKVYVGMYVHGVTGVSLKENQFLADCRIWFRWMSDEINPLDSFEITNGHIESKDGIYRSKLGNYNYAVCRVAARINKMWDVSRFPLDDHTLSIEIEDTDRESHKQYYLADTENCALDPGARIAGWRIFAKEPKVTEHRYNTNYGDMSLPTGHESKWSRFIFFIGIGRPGYASFIKLFAGLFVSAGIALLSLLIRPTDLDPRFGLGVGAMFAAVASEYILVGSLPETSGLTMADKLHILTFVFIFLTLAESAFSLKLMTAGKDAASRKLDRTAFGCLSASYCLIVAGIIGVAG